MTITNFSKPQHARYFEDYQVGTTYDLGSIEVEEEEVLSFARRFDPQKMHTDPEAAAAQFERALEFADDERRIVVLLLALAAACLPLRRCRGAYRIPRALRRGAILGGGGFLILVLQWYGWRTMPTRVWAGGTTLLVLMICELLPQARCNDR